MRPKDSEALLYSGLQGPREVDSSDDDDLEEGEDQPRKMGLLDALPACPS
jgi:hypothetical protein